MAVSNWLTETILRPLFGVDVDQSKLREKEDKRRKSFVAEDDDDGAMYVTDAGRDVYLFSGSPAVHVESDLTNHYRQMALYPEVDMAIGEITDEAVVEDEENQPVEINLEELPGLPNKVKKAIEEGFDHVLKVMDFRNKGHELFRRWYVDSRLVLHKIVDEAKPTDGVLEVRTVDPRRILRIKVVKETLMTEAPLIEVIDEYYVYSPVPFGGPDDRSMYGVASTAVGTAQTIGTMFGHQTFLQIKADAISYVTSGLTDMATGITYGYLQKAIRPLNHLTQIEDAEVVYRVVRAPARKVIYIDVGRMNAKRAKAYINSVISQHRNQITYDANTGEIRNDRRAISMIEDFWIPRREGSQGTQITELSGGNGLGDFEYIPYYREKLIDALNVPSSRFKKDNAAALILGKGAEITREELKFAKFVGRLRRRFSQVFTDILGTHLILTGVVKPDEWEELSPYIVYNWINDSFFSEAKESELLAQRLATASQVAPLIGLYYSHEYVRTRILKQTEEDMEEIDAQIAEEREDDRYALNPAAMQIMPGSQPPEAMELMAQQAGAEPAMIEGPPASPGGPGGGEPSWIGEDREDERKPITSVFERWTRRRK